jgi:cupin fold WbuC family metalloprotein
VIFLQLNDPGEILCCGDLIMENKKFPVALQPPQENVNLIDYSVIDHAIEMSRQSPRKRIIYPFHQDNANSLHRMLNAIQPGSYLRPHRHLFPPKDEAILVLRGALVCVIFSETGAIQTSHRLEANTPTFGIDITGSVYHTLVVSAPDTVIYEVKPGPFISADERDFAPWAPAEGTEDATRYWDELTQTILRDEP